MRHYIILLFIIATTALHTASRAQAPLLVKANKMTVQGTSTLHEWESQITKAEWKGTFSVRDNQLADIKNVEVKIPVESIKSTKGKIMDNKTYDAFKYEKHPYIIFSLRDVTIQPAGSLKAKGTLTMAGASKEIELNAKYKIVNNGDLQITLTQKLVMSEYKMDPPTAMMGTIKVGDEVTVNFDVVVKTQLIQ